MICTYCGKETSDDSVYCEHCGNYLANNIYDNCRMIRECLDYNNLVLKKYKENQETY